MQEGAQSRWHPIVSWIHRNPAAAVRPLCQVEREAIESAMILCGGDVDLAARRLGISKATLYRKLLELQRAAQ